MWHICSSLNDGTTSEHASAMLATLGQMWGDVWAPCGRAAGSWVTERMCLMFSFGQHAPFTPPRSAEQQRGQAYDTIPGTWMSELTS